MTRDQGLVLVRLARTTLASALGAPRDPPPQEPWLREPGATFVTLTLDGDLRGCIGSLEACRPLGEDVAENALAAAFRDPRFPPVAARELERLRIEVSLLGPSEPLGFTDEASALAALRPGRDGVVFEAGPRRATFLPQVWDQLPDRREFLAHLKAKAGLSRGYWGPEVRLRRYSVEKWGEESG